MKMRYLKKWIGLLGLLFVLTFFCSTVSAETTSFWNADVYDMQQGKIVGEIKLPCANGKVYLDQNGKSVALGFVEELNYVSSIIELTDKYVKYSDMDYQEHIKKF